MAPSSGGFHVPFVINLKRRLAVMRAALQAEALDPLARGTKQERQKRKVNLLSPLGVRCRRTSQGERPVKSFVFGKWTQRADHFGQALTVRDQCADPSGEPFCETRIRFICFSMSWFVGAPWGIVDVACVDFQSVQQFSIFTDLGASNFHETVNYMCEDNDQHCKAPSPDCGILSDGAAGDELRSPRAGSSHVLSDVSLQELGSGDLVSGASRDLCSCGGSCNCKLDSENAVQEVCCQSLGKPVINKVVLTRDDCLGASLAKFGVPVQTTQHESSKCGADLDSHVPCVQQDVVLVECSASSFDDPGCDFLGAPLVTLDFHSPCVTLASRSGLFELGSSRSSGHADASDCDQTRFDSECGCDFLGGPLTTPACTNSNSQLSTAVTICPADPGPGVGQTWFWGLGRAVGAAQWTQVPSRFINHCYLLAVRVGEATNPGPEFIRPWFRWFSPQLLQARPRCRQIGDAQTWRPDIGLDQKWRELCKGTQHSFASIRGVPDQTGSEDGIDTVSELGSPLLRTLGFRPCLLCAFRNLGFRPCPRFARTQVCDAKPGGHKVARTRAFLTSGGASVKQPWRWIPQCLSGLIQWACEPSKVIGHCYLLATRVGEASNPGPDSGQGSNANPSGAPSAFDIGNLLGPNFGAMLQNFIQQQIQSAVQAAVQEAMQKFQLNLQPPVKDERANQEAPPPKRRRKGKGQGNPSGEPPRADKVQESVGAKNKGKGKANAKPDEPKTQQQGGRGRGQFSSQKEADGKGVGAKASPPPQSSADNKDGWTQVKRQRDHTKDAPFALRQQDWNAPLVSFSGLAKRLQETKSDEVCRGVILCPRKEIETARALLAGTTKKYALLLIVLAKEYPEKPKDLKTQQVPGQIGNILRAQDAYIQQAVSTGQSAPQPVGISSTPQKVATKATAVLFVKVPRAFTEGSLWKNFVEKPQRQIAQWTAARHVLCIDCFQWAEEQLQGGRRQVHGVIRVAQADVSTLLAHSGEQGIFVQLPRDKVVGQHVEWAERITKGESDAEYLTRVNRARGDLGLVCRDLSLGWRRPNDPTTPVHKVWILEHAPKTWDLQQVAGLLKEQFSDINMFRQVHRGNWKNFIFRAACKRGCDADLVPVTVILDELGASNAPVTLWAKIAPPRHIEYKQRHIKGGSIPFFDKPSLFDPVTVPGPSNAKSDKEDEAEKANPTPDPKRTCSAKRPVPAGTILQKQPADGDCLFHSFSAGLFHLRKDKESEPIHPHELRARTVAHIRRTRRGINPNGRLMVS